MIQIRAAIIKLDALVAIEWFFPRQFDVVDMESIWIVLYAWVDT